MNESKPVRTNALTKSPLLRELESQRQEVLSGSLPAKVARQKINSLKQQQELALRELAAPAVAEVLARALQMALSGDRKMIELILSLHMSKPAAAEDTDSGGAKVQILVQNLTTKGGEMTVGVPKAPAPAVTIEATVLGDDNGKTDADPGHGDSEKHSQDDSVGSPAGSDDSVKQADGG